MQNDHGSPMAVRAPDRTATKSGRRGHASRPAFRGEIHMEKIC
jgi:hypothetical protein